MSASSAQKIWCQWPLADRLALLARWQARQSLSVRAGLSLLPEQAAAATTRSISRLPDARRQIAAYGPLGVVQLQLACSGDDDLLLVHLAWCCALGNAVIVRADSEASAAAVEALQELLRSADSALETLVTIAVAQDLPCDAVRRLEKETLHVVVAPSADVELLVKDALHASRVYGVVLWVNHALHFEVRRRLPKVDEFVGTDGIPAELQSGEMKAGSCHLTGCGSVAVQLQDLQAQRQKRTALYSGDWAEVERACDAAAKRGVAFAVNCVDTPPLGLFEAQALYQRPSLTVIAGV